MFVYITFIDNGHRQNALYCEQFIIRMYNSVIQLMNMREREKERESEHKAYIYNMS